MYQPPTGFRPSYHQGYARNASESAYPGLWRGLMGAWLPSFGPSGNTLYDLSGKKNHGVLTAMDPATDWIVGLCGYALDFNGVDQYVDLGDIAAADDSSSLSICATFKVNSIPAEGDSATIAMAFNAFETTSEYFLQLVSRSGTFEIAVGISNSTTNLTSIYETAGADIAAGVQVNVVFRWLGVNNFSVYLDGVLQDGSFILSEGPATIADTGQSTWIGARERPTILDFFDGSIGSVLFYDRGLAQSEINQLLNPLTPFQLRQPVWKAPEVVGGNAPTGNINGPLVGPMGGVI